VPVAKHGNRAATSTSGSADVHDLLGVRTDVSPQVAETCLNDIGICFMFAPRYHSLSATLAQARRSLGRPSIFNNLGPLCNPAAASHYIIGVWDKSLVEKTGNVLQRLGTTRSWIVHSTTGLDEIARKGPTHVADVNKAEVTMREISIADFESFHGHGSVPDNLGPTESALLIRKILSNKKRGSNSEKLVLINAAAAIYVAGRAATLPEAFAMATHSVASGAAMEKVRLLAEATNQ
jgi:anthranilate phosphoribosyltransferase